MCPSADTIFEARTLLERIAETVATSTILCKSKTMEASSIFAIKPCPPIYHCYIHHREKDHYFLSKYEIIMRDYEILIPISQISCNLPPLVHVVVHHSLYIQKHSRAG